MSNRPCWSVGLSCLAMRMLAWLRLSACHGHHAEWPSHQPSRSPLPADGKLMNDFTGRVRREEQGSPQGTVRTITVALDTAQYQVRAYK